MPDTYIFAKNGMGDYTTGTGMREDMLMKVFNIFLNDAGIASSGDLLTTETSSPSMGVTVAAGQCFVKNADYSLNVVDGTRFWGVLAEEHTISISANTSGSTRYDIMLIQISIVAVPDGYAKNVATVEILEGTPGAGVPATPSNSYKVCEIEVPDSATSILDANITDTRSVVSLRETSGDIPWTDWTPTCSASTGTYTSVTIEHARLKVVGKTVDLRLSVYGTTDSATQFLQFTAPPGLEPRANDAASGFLAAGGCRVADGAGGGQVGYWDYPTSTALFRCGRDEAGLNFTAGADRKMALSITYEID